jgi:hypothetical protein
MAAMATAATVTEYFELGLGLQHALGVQLRMLSSDRLAGDILQGGGETPPAEVSCVRT